MRTRHTSILMTTALVTAALLAGCAPMGPGTTTSTTQAAPATPLPSGSITCETITPELQAIGDEIGEVANQFATDAPGAVERISGLINRIGGLADATSDPELRTKLDGVKSAFDTLLSTLNTAIQDNSLLQQLGPLSEQVTEIGNALTAVSDYCRGQ